jgi:hypothetical protein
MKKAKKPQAKALKLRVLDEASLKSVVGGLLDGIDITDPVTGTFSLRQQPITLTPLG